MAPGSTRQRHDAAERNGGAGSEASASVLRMSLADIARTAQVERPVVSMWRKRANRAGVAFPEPVGERDGHDEFDAHAVADFLRRTRLGNNPTAPDDVVAFARPEGALADGVSPQLTTALLTVAACSNELIADLDSEELAGYAADLDPDDVCLRREIEAALPLFAEVASYVDRLAESAYSARAALEVAARDFIRRVGGARRRTVLDADVTRLVASIAVAVARSAGVEPMRFIDPTPSDGRLLAAVAEQATNAAAEFAVVETDCDATRLARRRLLSRDISPELLPLADGDLELGGPAVLVGALPSAADPAMNVGQMLDAVNDITLVMSSEQWGVLLAPSTVLTDKLPAKLVGARDAVIRDGRLRMAVRLPTGLAVHQGQTHLALWVFGPTPHHVARGDRGTVVADLSDIALTDEVIDELATDAVTSLASVQFATKVHAFHRSTIIPTTRLLSDSASLVADATPTTYAGTEGLADRIERLRLAAGTAGEDWSTYAAPTAPVGAVATVTLGRAMRSGWVRLIRGHRIKEQDIVAQAIGAPVIGPPELAGRAAWGAGRIDLFELAGSYPGARLTEPGDVIFATGGEVTARVDRYGGSVVRSPARILRVRGGPPDAELLPDVIVADLRAQRAGARRFESWPVRLVPSDLRQQLQVRAAALAEAEAQLRSQLEAVQWLQASLIDGVVSRTVRLADSDIHPDSQASQDDSADHKGEETAT